MLLENPMMTLIGQQCRRVAALVIARAWPGRSVAEVLDRLSRLPLGGQVGAVGGVLAVLLAAALIAAQFGPLGLAVYFVAVVALVR